MNINRALALNINKLLERSSVSHLLHLLPVVVVVAHHHGHELRGLEEREDLPTTDLQETAGESRIQLLYGITEYILQIRLNKLLPERGTYNKKIIKIF